MTPGRPENRRILLCRALIQIRKAVGDSLGYALCSSPVWDMLLDLYLAEQEHRDVYLWPLCIAANTPLSTAHRRISEMEKLELLVRHAGNRDRRRIGVRLTEKGAQTVTSLLDRVDQICHRILSADSHPGTD
jgi:predicted transcriptional regulator